MQTTKQSFLATTPGVLLGALLSCFLWGSAFPCIKIGYELFSITANDTASMLLFAGVRFALAGVLVIAWGSLTQKRALVPARTDLKAIALLALFQTVLQYIFFYLGLSKAAGLTSSIIGASSNFLAIVIAAFVFKSEQLTTRKILGCALGFAGVVLINLDGEGSLRFSFAGEGMILISTIGAAFATCLIAQFGKTKDPALLVGWQFLLGGTVLSATGALLGGQLHAQTPAAWALLAYMAFISAGAYSMWSYLLRQNPVSRVSVFGFMNPLFGAILSALLLGEAALVEPWRVACALTLVAAGIVIVNQKQKEATADLSTP